MMDDLWSTYLLGAALLVASLLATGLFRASQASGLTSSKEAVPQTPVSESVQKLINKLRSALPSDTLLLQTAASESAAKSHWARQESEKPPACVIQPRNSEQLSSAIKVLAAEHAGQDGFPGPKATADPGSESLPNGLFAVRGGGHSPVAGASSMKGGILIDLGKMNQVVIASDRTTVSVGSGARWGDVFRALDDDGLAAVGGRNTDVGVAGLTLGGGLSFYSPRYGMVCSNVVEFEVILASGALVTASASTNSDLWHALKGGSNNFGIVTRFTLRCFPSTGVWSGFLFLLSSSSKKVIAAFHEAVTKADPRLSTRDKFAAGPLAAFTYVQPVNMTIVSVNLAYTDNGQLSSFKGKWPAYWQATPFSKLWRLWSTCKMRSMTDAADEMNALNPVGDRQLVATTTVKNDPETLAETYNAYHDATSEVCSVRRINFTMIMQPFMPEWACKGDPNPLGLDEDSPDPLVVISFAVNWQDAKDDEFVRAETRRALERIGRFAEARGTGHRYRYLNYCTDWQKPFQGYGEKNLEFLKEVSRRYDPDGLFQTGCTGGFKLWAKSCILLHPISVWQ